MTIALHDLCAMHPKPRGDPADLPRFGALALQRSGHTCPVTALVDHDGVQSHAEIEWHSQDLALLRVLDANRVTEDGAEAVALVYAFTKAGWVVKRRFQRGEHADWLLYNKHRSLALEVSGTAAGDPYARLEDKKRQAAQCTLPTNERLAIIVAFDRPSIMAGTP